jgi:hypothetical protein
LRCNTFFPASICPPETQTGPQGVEKIQFLAGWVETLCTGIPNRLAEIFYSFPLFRGRQGVCAKELVKEFDCFSVTPEAF